MFNKAIINAIALIFAMSTADFLRVLFRLTKIDLMILIVICSFVNLLINKLVFKKEA